MIRRSNSDKPGVGYSTEYARRAGNYKKEEVRGELLFDLKTIAKRVIKAMIESGRKSYDEIDPKAISMTVGTIARRELTEKYVSSGKMNIDVFKNVLKNQFTARSVEHIIAKMKSNEKTKKEDQEDFER